MVNVNIDKTTRNVDTIDVLLTLVYNFQKIKNAQIVDIIHF